MFIGLEGWFCRGQFFGIGELGASRSLPLQLEALGFDLRWQHFYDDRQSCIDDRGTAFTFIERSKH